MASKHNENAQNQTGESTRAIKREKETNRKQPIDLVEANRAPKANTRAKAER